MNSILEQILATCPLPVIGESKAINIFYKNLRKQALDEGLRINEKKAEELENLAFAKMVKFKFGLYALYSTVAIGTYKLAQIIF